MFVLRCVFVLSLTAKVRSEVDGYIVNGEKAKIQKFPHSACLGVTCIFDYEEVAFLCGSSILNQRILLTAAHCLYFCNSKAIVEVNVGSSSRLKGFSTMVKQYMLNSRYHPSTSAHDIALVKTKQNISFSKNICRLSILPNPTGIIHAKLAGWGLVDEVHSITTTKLKKIDQTVWRKSRCEKVLGKIPSGCFCAANDDPKRYPSRKVVFSKRSTMGYGWTDVSSGSFVRILTRWNRKSGDSGSALVVRDYIGIGMVSYKKPSYADHLIVYTNISYHYQWIQVNAKRLYCLN